jgi:hypothetical protein
MSGSGDLPDPRRPAHRNHRLSGRSAGNGVDPGQDFVLEVENKLRLRRT